jgi:hypothetical protein
MPSQIRVLQAYTAVSTTLLFVLVGAAFKHSDAALRLDELTVTRINVVDSTGRVRLRIAGSFPPRRNDLAGILFTDNDGIEAGGLVYRGRKMNGKVSATGTLTMDQYNEDQVVALQYNQDGARRSTGLSINDRPDSLGPELGELYRVLDPMPESPRRDSIARALLAKVPVDQRAARRVFIGRDSAKSAVLSLADRAGVPRIRLVVDSLGHASMVFLDAHGNVSRSISDVSVSQ